MNIIELKKVNFNYGDLPILEDVSFSIKKGDMVALIGPNGSGKTTLVKNIIGLLKPKSGEILINGEKAIDNIDKIGYVPQRFEFDRNTPITLNEFLSLEKCGKDGHDCKNIDSYLDKVDLASYKNKRLSSLSGGQFQRAMIARALLHEKEILIFDEPSTGIDLAGEKTVYDLISLANKENKVTCLIVSHDLSVVSSFTKKVICINKKIICQGSPNKIINPKTLEELYGVKIGLYHSH